MVTMHHLGLGLVRLSLIATVARLVVIRGALLTIVSEIVLVVVLAVVLASTDLAAGQVVVRAAGHEQVQDDDVIALIRAVVLIRAVIRSVAVEVVVARVLLHRAPVLSLVPMHAPVLVRVLLRRQRDPRWLEHYAIKRHNDTNNNKHPPPQSEPVASL